MLTELSDRARNALLERSVEKHFSTGQILWSAGDTPQGIVLVLEGKVRIVRGRDGRQTVIHTGEPGMTLGEIPFFTRETYPATAIASEPTRCLVITHAALEHALKTEPEAAFYFLERLSHRVKELVEKLAQRSSESVQSRLSRFILDRAGRSGRKGSAFSLGMTQADLAEELGTVREVVVKELRALRNSGAIEAAGAGRYRVVSASKLRKAMNPEGG